MNLNHFFYREHVRGVRRVLLVFSFSVFVIQVVCGQNQKITLPKETVTLLKGFETIEKQSGYRISYNQTKLNVNRVVRLNGRHKRMASLLDELLKESGFTYRLEANYVVIIPLAEEDKDVNQPTTKMVSGTVADAKGEPIVGASVIEKGTTNGVITDTDGAFSISLKGNGMLAVSYIGYQNVEIKVIGADPIRVVLVEDQLMLDEVVVVGYGTQKKLNLTGAVSAISGQEMNKRPVVNAANMLQGQVPGLRVVQNSGQPGAESANFRIRGQGTYSDAGSDPLILINGVPGSLSMLDPNIIESVSVLKDAASGAIYGSRAANGVVLVTTKKGSLSSSGKRFSAIYSGAFSIYSPTRMLNAITNSAEYMTLFNQAKKNSEKSGLYDENEIKMYREKGGTVAYPNFDWVDYMFNPAFVQNHHVSLSGNSDRTMYNVGLSFVNQPGTMRGFEYKKYNFSVDLNSQLTDWLKVGTYISANYGDQLQPRNGASDAFLCALAQAPTAMPWLPDDGTGVRRYTFGAFPNIEQSNKNMLAMSSAGINIQNKTIDLNGQFFVEFSPFKGFKWHTKLAGRLVDDKTKDWSGTKVPLFNYRTGEMVRYMDIGGGFIPGLVVQDDQTLYTNFYSFMEYQLPIEKEHHLTVMIGYNQERNTQDVIWAKRINYQFDLPELDAGSNEKMENSGYKKEWAIVSGFFRANYDYRGIYLAEVNARYDGTSRIAKENRWGVFPSFSLGYRMTEEAYMKKLNLHWLGNLKIRGSWGQLGNQNIGLYPFQEIVDMTDSYSFDNMSLTQGVAQTAYFNRNLRWETTTITDLGVDIALCSNRLNVVFDWYSKKTTDILRQAQVSNFIGLSAPTVNSGEMLNRGFEAAASWTDYVKKGALKGLFYKAGFYLDHSKNKLTKFGEEEKKENSILREGIPYNSFYMLKAVGIFSDQDEIDAAPKQFADQTKPGDIRYWDADGNGKIDYEDRVVMKGRFPDWEYSFNGEVAWKGFDLSVLFQGVQGVSAYVGAGAGVAPFAYGSLVTTDYIKGMWTEEHPKGAKNPRLYFADMGGNRNTRANSYYLRDASYLRLKNLAVGYTLPTSLTQRAAIQKLRFFFSGDNLFTWTDYEGLDPENGNSFLKFPQNRILSLGVNVEF